MDSETNVFIDEVNASSSTLWKVDAVKEGPMPWADGEIVYIVGYTPPPPPPPGPADGTVGSITLDGNVYKTVVYGGRTWLAENLRSVVNDGVDSFNPDNVAANSDEQGEYGRLYNKAGADAAAASIPGWSIPTDQEWKALETTLGMSTSDANNPTPIGIGRDTSFRGSPVGTALKLTGGATVKAGGTSTSGMDIPLAGDRLAGAIRGFGTRATFWTSTPSGATRYVKRFFKPAEAV